MTTTGKPYYRVWGLLFVGWFISYFDRTITGPIVTWMIENDVAFLASVDNPYALGGLLGSLFFVGYMLTQFPGGYFGDKFGYRNMILISIFWAGVTTLLTGLFNGLFLFIALRILTGLGEGVLYSNDRSFIAQVTPPKKMGLGMGVVISGLSVGLTAGLLVTPYMIEMSRGFLGNDAWKAPFFILGALTILIGFVLKKYLIKTEEREPSDVKMALLNIGRYSLVFLAIILGVYYIADFFKLGEVNIAIIFTLFAFLFIAYIYKTKKEVAPVLRNRNLVLLYLSAIPILWHLWFYGFWSVAIVQEFGGSGFLAAALIASFNAVAGLIGFPLGGAISDRVAHKENGRKNVLVWLSVGLTISVFVFAFYMVSGKNNPVIMSTILFVSGLLFFAVQAVQHAMVTELATEKQRGSAFGMWNLIAEIGALLSPVISGVLRDSTGGWGAPLFLDAILLGISCLLIVCIGQTRVVSLKQSIQKSI
ncbi:MFS transporter [Sporosarcina sp. FSL W7-1349]|uniref:MFS transporter n=1 Tax=Sporosarcina sp. FSL W7-1349 TaxID=2921561 RepID=UPI0030FCB6B7